MGCFHHLTNKETKQFVLTTAIGRNIIRVIGDDFINDGLNRARISDLLQPFFINNCIGVFTTFHHIGKNIFGDFSGNRFIGNEVDQFSELISTDRTFINIFVRLVQGAKQITRHPVGGEFTVTAFGDGFKIGGFFFIGGQNQRVGIARAMILQPELVICDEAVSALDVSIQAEIIDLLIDLQNDFGMSLLFISHDLSVVREISHRVMVLYLGRIVELADRDAIYDDARHPYTRALISAVPTPDPKIERSKPRIKLEGDLPSPLDTRASLRFLKSKVVDDPDAEQYRPKLIEVAPGHFVAEFDEEKAA